MPESVKLCCCCCCCCCCRCFGSALRLVATCVFPAEKPETALETEKTHPQSFSARLRRSSREFFFLFALFIFFYYLPLTCLSGPDFDSPPHGALALRPPPGPNIKRSVPPVPPLKCNSGSSAPPCVHMLLAVISRHSGAADVTVS